MQLNSSPCYLAPMMTTSLRQMRDDKENSVPTEVKNTKNRDIKNVIVLACSTLGLPADYLPSIGGYDLEDLSFSDFLILFEFLRVSINNANDGYNSKEHRHQVAQAIYRKQFRLRFNPKIRQLCKESDFYRQFPYCPYPRYPITFIPGHTSWNRTQIEIDAVPRILEKMRTAFPTFP